MKKIFLLIAVCCFLVMVEPKSAFAQNDVQKSGSSKIIRVTPIILNPTLMSGSKQTFEMSIENILNVPVGIRLNLENLDATDEENGIGFSTPQSNSPIFSMIKISQTELIIPEKSTKTIEISINIPKNTKPGAFTAIVFLTPFYTKQIDTLSPTVVGRIGSLLLINIGKPEKLEAAKKISIITANFNNIYDSKTVTAILRIKNISSFYFPVKPFIEIKPLFGKKQTIELDEKRILPDKIRSWHKNINLNIGIYKATINATLEGGNKIIKNEYFIVFPLKNIGLILGTLILIILLIKGRKRIKKAVSIFIKNK